MYHKVAGQFVAQAGRQIVGYARFENYARREQPHAAMEQTNLQSRNQPISTA